MFYLGLDLGKRLDFSAICVVDKFEPGIRFDYVEWMHKQYERRGLSVRYLEQIHLGTPYTQVVARIEHIVTKLRRQGQCEVVVDATGVGMPVVDMLREAKLDCNLTPVLITSGVEQHKTDGVWHVPKVDLMAGVQSALESGLLRIARRAAKSRLLVEELMNVRAKLRGTGKMRLGADAFGQHDDLVIAVALAVWGARKPVHGERGDGRLV